MFGGAKRLPRSEIAKVGTILLKISASNQLDGYGGPCRVARHRTRKGGWTTENARRAEQSKGNHERHEKHEKDRATAGPAEPAARDEKRAPQPQTSQVRGLCCDAVFVSPPAKRPVAAALRALRALRSNLVFVIFVCLLCSGTSGGNELPMSIGCVARRPGRNSTACRRTSRCTRVRSRR